MRGFSLKENTHFIDVYRGRGAGRRVRLWVCEKKHMWVQVNPTAKIYTHHEKDSIFSFYLKTILGKCVCLHVCMYVCKHGISFLCVCICACAGMHVWCVHMCVCACVHTCGLCLLMCWCVADFRLFLLMLFPLLLRQNLSLRNMGYMEPARLGSHGLDGSVLSTPPALVFYVGAAG